MSTGLISYIVTQSITTTVEKSKHVVCMNVASFTLYYIIGMHIQTYSSRNPESDFLLSSLLLSFPNISSSHSY